MPSLPAEGAGLWIVSFGMGVASGLIPLVNIEVYLLAAATLAPASAVGVVLPTTLGQLVAKCILYLAGQGVLRLPLGRARRSIDRASAALKRHPGRTEGFVLVSAITGVPPFYGTSVAAGALRIPFLRFLAPAALGRLLRFSLVFGLPRLLAR